jgi:nucleotide-binding universal stress UspA family protein
MTTAAHEMLARIVREKDIEWTPLVAIGHPADEIARVALEEQVDMVISATHGRSGLKRLVLGSVTERLMRTLACPLLIVRERSQPPGGAPDAGFHPRTILVGCDFSADSDLAFQYGLSLAQEFESELHLVHVIEPPVYQNVLSVDDAEMANREDIAPRLRRKLAEMVPADASHWCSPVTVLLEGKTDEELSRYAMLNDIDLIVLGVHGHGLVEKLFVGSTTDRVARQAKCPVLAVKPVA